MTLLLLSFVGLLVVGTPIAIAMIASSALVILWPPNGSMWMVGVTKPFLSRPLARSRTSESLR